MKSPDMGMRIREGCRHSINISTTSIASDWLPSETKRDDEFEYDAEEEEQLLSGPQLRLQGLQISVSVGVGVVYLRHQIDDADGYSEGGQGAVICGHHDAHLHLHLLLLGPRGEAGERREHA